MNTIWLVNGREVTVHPADRGLSYGDGLFETMAVCEGRIRWFDYHLDRLSSDCERLGIVAPQRSLLEREVAQLLPPQGRAVAKIIVTRGVGSRGYSPPENAIPTRIVSVGPWPDYAPENYTRGIAVTVGSMRLGENPELAGIKHLGRLEQVMARRQLDSTRFTESLMQSQSGDVIGGTMSNVFAVIGRKLSTPLLDRCGIRGVMRRIVLEKAIELQADIHEERMSLKSFLDADEIFLTNAVFGIWPVKSIDDQSFEFGDTTRALMNAIGADS